MNTFLTSSDFQTCANHLDYRRLGKQRIEADECLAVCLDTKRYWMSDKQFEYIKRRYQNGPVVKLWKGYEEALKLYTNCMISEWIRRGYVNNLRTYIIDYSGIVYPHWLGNEELHSSYRAALLQKARDTGRHIEWYSQWGWNETPKIEYIWNKAPNIG